MMILVSFAAAFAIALGAVTIASRSVAANEPIYRLDAGYHHLPPELVAELLAHPPTRRWLSPKARCEILDDPATRPEYTAPKGYCICWGEGCATAPDIHASYENWVCTGPLGAVGTDGVREVSPVA